MARKKFEDGFKEDVVQYCKDHPEKTIKACAEDKGIGYSTLRRWLSEAEEKVSDAPKVEEKDAVEEKVQQEPVKEEAEQTEVKAAPVAETKTDTKVKTEVEPEAEEATEPVKTEPVAAEAPKVREEKKDEAKPEPKAEPKAPTLVAESAEFKAKVAQLPTATPAAKRASSFGAQHKTNPNRPTVGEIAQGIEAGVNNVKERLGRFTKQLGMKKRKK